MLIVGMAAIVVVCWLVSGFLFRPVPCGHGPCKDCGRPGELFRFGESLRCRACYDRIDSWIP